MIVGAGFVIGAACVIPDMLRGSPAAYGTTEARLAVGSPKEAGKTIRQVLREAAHAIQTSPDPSARTYALVEIIKAQGRADDREGALESARQAVAAALALAPKPRCWALVAIAWARSIAGDREGALNSLRLARRHADESGTDHEKIQALRMIASSQFDLGEPTAASDTIAKMREIAFAIKPRRKIRVALQAALTDLVWALTYVGNDDEAFRTVAASGAADHHMQGQLYEAMVSAATADSGYFLQPPKTLDEGHRKASRQVLDRIIKAVEPFEFAEERPDMQLAIGLAKLGDFQAAVQFAHRFGKGPIKYAQSIDLTAAPLVLSAVAGYQGKAGHRAEASRTIQEALDMVQRDSALVAGRLGQVALGQAEAGDVAGALKTLKFVEPEQRVRFLAEMAEGQEKPEDMAGSQAIYRRALEEVERCLRPAQPPAVDRTPKEVLADADGTVKQHDRGDSEIQRQDDLLTLKVKFNAKLGNLQAAVETYRLITGESFRESAASDIADARSKAGDAEGALTWALALDTPSVRVSALRGLAAGVLAGR